MNLYPKTCNLCGGKVEYIGNDKIYGRKYGSGYCYHCRKCGAYVGTHKPRPKEALGILADKEMRQMKMACHDIFDTLWKTHKERQRCYKMLADKLGIDVKDCHFGYFDKRMLQASYEILQDMDERSEKDGVGNIIPRKACR